MRSDAQNLEAISKAIDQHEANCTSPAIEIAMNPFEIERLGWDAVCGLPIVPDGKLPTGRFEVRCERDKVGPKKIEIEKKEPVPAGA